MTLTRPYIQKTGKELEALFESSKTDLPTVKRILAELKHRKTASSALLRDKVEKYIKAGNSANEQGKTPRPEKHAETEKASHHIVDCKGCDKKIRIPLQEACIVYRCPKCQLSFEAKYRAGVMEIVFLKKVTPPKNQEHITDEVARSILGVSARAPFAEIKAAWRKLSQQYHPDKHQGLPGRLRQAAELEMGRINQAYQLLQRNSAEDF